MLVEELSYVRYTGRPMMDKAINTLLGLVEGVAIDGAINPKERSVLNLWLEEHSNYKTKHPFNELIPLVERTISDSFIDNEERQDILWLCERLKSTRFYDETTADLQILQGFLGGVAADGEVTEEELSGLRAWLDDHDYLRRCYPYDEVDSLITSVLKDGSISPDEHKALQSFFGEFITVLDNRTITSPVVSLERSLQGVCAVCPEIIFQDSSFCFTGESSRFTRNEFHGLITRLGGTACPSVTKKLDYLVIGADGNPCWAYACYGRKVEKAIELRKSGSRVLLVHEHDFHDAIADFG